MNDDESAQQFPSDSFPDVLIGDVVVAWKELAANDTATNRRSAVRTTFAAIEGLVSIVKSGMDVLPLSPGELSIVKEETYEVSENGSIRARPRGVPFERNLKAVVRIINRLRPAYNLDFDHPGWHALSRSLEVRHRLTHPKELCDLDVTKQEIADLQRGFSWFLAFVIKSMYETNKSVKQTFEAWKQAMKRRN